MALKIVTIIFLSFIGVFSLTPFLFFPFLYNTVILA